jgi:hypothetical protein
MSLLSSFTEYTKQVIERKFRDLYALTTKVDQEVNNEAKIHTVNGVPIVEIGEAGSVIVPVINQKSK